MDDNTLLKISCIGGCIGIFSLFLIMCFTENKTYTIEDFKDIKEGEKFIMYGIAEQIKESEKAVGLEMTEIKKIKQNGVYFKSKGETINITNGEHIRVKAMKYNDQILIDKIDKVE